MIVLTLDIGWMSVKLKAKKRSVYMPSTVGGKQKRMLYSLSDDIAKTIALLRAAASRSGGFGPY